MASTHDGTEHWKRPWGDLKPKTTKPRKLKECNHEWRDYYPKDGWSFRQCNKCGKREYHTPEY